jgi:hypothetical protein
MAGDVAAPSQMEQSVDVCGGLSQLVLRSYEISDEGGYRSSRESRPCLPRAWPVIRARQSATQRTGQAGGARRRAPACFRVMAPLLVSRLRTP